MLESLDNDELLLKFPNGDLEISLSCRHFLKTEEVFRSGRSALRIRKTDCDADPSKIVIWLRGGPFKQRTNDLNAERSWYLKHRFMVIEPDYIGTYERDLNILNITLSPNFADGIAELRGLIKFFKSRGSQIIIHGESFGGYVASFLASNLGAEDLLVLQCPMNDTPRQRFVQTGEQFNLAGVAGVVRAGGKVVDYKYWTVAEKKAVSQQYWLGFFKGSLDTDIQHNLNSNLLEAPIKIIFGRQDNIVPAKKIRAIKSRVNRIEKLELIDSGHEMVNSKANFLKFQKFIVLQ